MFCKILQFLLWHFVQVTQKKIEVWESPFFLFTWIWKQESMSLLVKHICTFFTLLKISRDLIQIQDKIKSMEKVESSWLIDCQCYLFCCYTFYYHCIIYVHKADSLSITSPKKCHFISWADFPCKCHNYELFCRNVDSCPKIMLPFIDFRIGLVKKYKTMN